MLNIKGVPRVDITMLEGNWDSLSQDVKLKMSMTITNGTGAKLSAYPTEQLYNNKGDIAIYGNYSATLAKKPLKITTLKDGTTAGTYADNKVTPFGFPSETDWRLTPNLDEPAMINNLLANEMGRRIGSFDWCERSQFVEVYMDGVYRGLYVFTEKIKVATGRVNITKSGATPADIGYLFELMPSYRLEEGDTHFTLASERNWVAVSPKPESITQPQLDYIHDFVQAAENSLADTSTGDWLNYFDANNFIDFYIIQELCKNADGPLASMYFYREKGGKIKFVLHDFNFAFGFYPDGLVEVANKTPQGYYMRELDPWYAAAFANEDFVAMYKARLQSKLPALHSAFGDVQTVPAQLKATGALQENNTLWAIEDYDDILRDRIKWTSDRLFWLQYKEFPVEPKTATVGIAQ